MLGKATQASFIEAELLLDHAKRVLNLGPDVALGGLDQILESSLWCVRQAAEFTGPHRHPELLALASYLWSLGNALVAGIFWCL